MCSLGPTNQDTERNLGAGAGFALLVYLKSAIFVASDCFRCGGQRRRPCSLAELRVRQAQSPRNNMDVECEPGCSFSTGSYSGSVRELAGEPAQHQKNSPLLAFATGSCVVAAAGPWSCFFFFSHVESLLLLIC
jgi:hypothetical protein